MMPTIPAEWVRIKAATGFSQISTTGKKVKTKDCLEVGKFPVIDQGQGKVAGYVDDPDKLIAISKPIIVFGDHTRAIKWVDFDFVPGADGTKVLQPDMYLLPRFAYFQMRALEIPDKGYSRHFKFLKELDFAVPPIAEQKVIADKLDTLLAQVDNTKARLERIPEILKRFRQSVLAAAVSGRLTEGWRGNEELTDWKENELSHFIEKPRYGSSAKSQKSGDVPVLRMGNLQDGQLDWTDLVYTSDPSEIEKYRLEDGDVLFNRTNSPELVGKTSIFRGEREAVYAGYLIKVKCLSSLEPEFLNYQLNSPKARSYCKAVKSDGVSQSNINAKKLAAYPLNCPPLEEQAEIVRRVDQLFAYADTVERLVNNALERVNQLTQSILAKAFRGELTAQWREDHPALISGDNSAEALLERIKAERAAQAPKKRTRKKATA